MSFPFAVGELVFPLLSGNPVMRLVLLVVRPWLLKGVPVVITFFSPSVLLWGSDSSSAVHAVVFVLDLFANFCVRVLRRGRCPKLLRGFIPPSPRISSRIVRFVSPSLSFYLLLINKVFSA